MYPGKKMSQFTSNEETVLNLIQSGVAVSEDPFGIIAKDAGIRADEAIDIVDRMKRKGVIRNIAGIFNGEKLGYYLSLVALSVSEENIRKASEIINSHPGVSHNYLRSHKYNIWFTLAEENEDMFNRSLRVIREISEADDFLVLRNEKLFKLGVMLEIGNKKSRDSQDSGVPGHGTEFSKLNDHEKEGIRLLQMDLPVEQRPFQKLIDSAGSFLTEEDLIRVAKSFRDRGIMRRYSAVLRHVKAGYSHNAMTAWKPDRPDNSDTYIKPFIEEGAVTHLYLRTVYPGRWEYPLFAMIHARTEPELQEIIFLLSEKSGIEEYLVLRTEKEFKKKRVTYFSGKFTEWRSIIK